jgi:ferredoxin
MKRIQNITPMALRSMPEDMRPVACLGCKSCEAVCLQNIRISEALADFAARLSASILRFTAFLSCSSGGDI